ncbi:hypothetical protein LY39_03639 [Roseinatronobacter bogoriensis subsp. barguzinensis]|nr:hypothetical protein LY39_03639 [Rhodobaca barguzinensis]TDY65956.1 hypothetical protein EV660_11519 [Rhodobaca bogoriensis DSM 18756]
MCFHLFVELEDHHGLNPWQQFRQDQGRHAQRLTQRECRGHVPADHRTRRDAQLAAQTPDQIPDLPTFLRERAVQPRGAVRARPFAALEGLTGFAVARAPAELPLGKGAEAFFSCSSSRPFET